MSLTGGWFGWAVGAVTVAAFVVVTVLWPRVSGPGGRQLAGRAGMLLAVNVLVLLTAAVRLNDAFLFFADWSDLRGAITGDTASTGMHRGGAAAAAAGAPVSGVAASSTRLEPLPAGTRLPGGVMSYQVSGPLSGITAQVLVTVPAGYDPGDAAARYPVLETFAGYPSSPAQWVRTMHLPTVLADLVRAHRVHPLVIVSPQFEVPAGTDSECVDGRPGLPQVETWLTRDVPNWVADHFRVRTDRSAWATMGLSTGGWCAAMAAVLHPAQYGGAIVMGGYFRPMFEPGYYPLVPGSGSGRYDLVARVRREAPPLAVWVQTSHADPVSYTSTTQLLTAARKPLSVSTVVLQNAGHRIGVWQQLLPSALIWLGADVPGFRP